MKIPRPRRRKSGDNVTPLINVVFLLLIFFMLTSSFVQPELFPVAPPQSISEAMPGDKNRLTILVSADGRLALGKTAVEAGDIGAEVAKRKRANRNLRIEVKADGKVPAGRILALLDRLRAVGVNRIGLTTARRAR